MKELLSQIFKQMQKKIQSALISVFYKDGLAPLIEQLHRDGVKLYSTGGTQTFIEEMGIPCVNVESLTGYPSILGGRVKTLHPAVFGAILGRRDHETDLAEMEEYKIPQIDLVVVNLYPFEETVQSGAEEQAIIEKIDIGGPSMIRAAAKNFASTVVVAQPGDYETLLHMLQEQEGGTTLEQRKEFARKAFDVCTQYDNAISNYFNGTNFQSGFSGTRKALRYGENPHQNAYFTGNLQNIFLQLHGKELSYNNLVDVDAALSLHSEFTGWPGVFFAIIKHTNVCGAAIRPKVYEAFDWALAGDPESAFGGILVTNGEVDLTTAQKMKDLFFEVLIAPSFSEDALEVLKLKKNRILLELRENNQPKEQYRSLLNGLLVQETDKGNFNDWTQVGGRETTTEEAGDLEFANLICKHLKSNAIAIVKNKQLLGKGCGQTSRIDALRQSIEKAHQFGFDLHDAVVASDAFFPFDDCVRIAHAAGIEAFVQPGGSIRDKDSIEYCKEHNLAMVFTGLRHFKH